MSYFPSIARFRGITTGKIITMQASGGNQTFDVDVGGQTFRTHVFTSTGLNKLNITRISNVQEYSTIEGLIIAGGGGGGWSENWRINPSGGGGGGAGGVVEFEYIVKTKSVNVFVGAGGRSGGFSGQNSYVGESGTFNITALGGGGGGNGNGVNGTAGGGSNNPQHPYVKGKDGGSGGGGGRAGDRGLGLQPGYTYTGFGNHGFAGQGTGAAIVSPAGVGKNGGGGGGSGSAASGRSGGGGRVYNIHSPTKTNKTFAYGGTGGTMTVNANGATGPANTGAGGGGGSANEGSAGPSFPGGNGGSGIVVIRYPIEVV